MTINNCGELSYLAYYQNWNYIRGCAKKSGLASEALTRVQEQLEQNGQFLQIPYKNCETTIY